MNRSWLALARSIVNYEFNPTFRPVIWAFAGLIRSAMTRRRRLLNFIAVVAILGTVWSVLYPAIRAAREASLFPDGPYGALIPSDPPIESRRIPHASGFSIVVPPNWELFDHGNTVQVAARHREGGMRLRSFITIARDVSMDAARNSWKRTNSHGCVAYEKAMRVEREYTFDDPAFSSYCLLVDVSGTWWLVEFGLAQERNSLPPEIAAYIDSIRFNESASELMKD
jgi:hypothetical protein